MNFYTSIIEELKNEKIASQITKIHSGDGWSVILTHFSMEVLPFECTICAKTFHSTPGLSPMRFRFRNRQTLRRHMKSFHDHSEVSIDVSVGENSHPLAPTPPAPAFFTSEFSSPTPTPTTSTYTSTSASASPFSPPSSYPSPPTIASPNVNKMTISFLLNK